MGLGLVGCAKSMSVEKRPAPTEHHSDGCLPSDLHGQFVEQRGKWRLYYAHDRNNSFPILTHVLEHVGPHVVTQESDLLALREKVPGDFVTNEIPSFGVGFCGEGLPPAVSKWTCLYSGIRAGVDPFAVAVRLDEFLGTSHSDLCFGVAIGKHQDVSAKS